MKFFKPVLFAAILIAVVESALIAIVFYLFQDTETGGTLSETAAVALIFGLLVIQLFGAIFSQLQLKKAYQAMLTYGISLGGAFTSLLLAFVLSTVVLYITHSAEDVNLGWFGLTGILLLLGTIFSLFTAMFVTKSAKNLQDLDKESVEEFGSQEDTDPTE